MVNESIEVINQRLKDHFSTAWNGAPIWRVVWSEDQFEIRQTKYTDSGLELLHPEMRKLPKYRQFIHNRYVLERYVIVPDINEGQISEKTSYEPIHVFEDRHGNALPPKWEACEYVIKVLLAVTKGERLAAYKEALAKDEDKDARLAELQQQLFGNETDIGDALAHKEGVGYTGPIDPRLN